MNHKIFTHGDSKHFAFSCPACKRNHVVPIVVGPEVKGPIWGWNGNEEKPSLTPSLRVFASDGQTTACHCNVTDGQIVYHGDSAHSMRGTTVPLPEWHSVLEDEE